MAGYVEYIKVGSGESWPVRDAETQARVIILEETVSSTVETVETMETTVSATETKVAELEERVENARLEHSNLPYLPLNEDGAITSPLILIAGLHYGDTFPDDATAGRLFFKKVASTTEGDTETTTEGDS